MAALQKRYRRPVRLSDPYQDNSPHSLKELLSTPDEKLTWSDYQTLLGPHLPAGTYEEVAYFLPLAFEYIRNQQQHALDLCTTITGFCSNHSKQLQADGVLESVRHDLAGLLELWTASFHITHFDELACRAKGWRIKYFDYVQRSETVYETLCDLVQFVLNADLAERFVTDLAAFESNPTKAAWLLDLVRSRDDPYHPPEIPIVQSCAADVDLLQRAFECAVAEESLRYASRTYWNDTIHKLALKGVHIDT